MWKDKGKSGRRKQELGGSSLHSATQFTGGMWAKICVVIDSKGLSGVELKQESCYCDNKGLRPVPHVSDIYGSKVNKDLNQDKGLQQIPSHQ